MILALVGAIISPARARADGAMSVEEAKEYLLTYTSYAENDFGEPLYVRYEFQSSEQLDAAADLLIDMGVDEFNDYIDDLVDKELASEPQVEAPVPAISNPGTLYRTVSGNGSHDISASTTGLSNFGKYGSIMFNTSIGMRVNVTNGKISSCSSPWFKVSDIGAGGRLSGWSAIPTGCNPGESASCTANFQIERYIGVGALNVVVGTNSEIVCLIALQG